MGIGNLNCGARVLAQRRVLPVDLRVQARTLLARTAAPWTAGHGVRPAAPRGREVRRRADGRHHRTGGGRRQGRYLRAVSWI